MRSQELYEELAMSYDELVKYLLSKYGAATFDYFSTPECRSKNKKVTRTSDGLLCHHIEECKGGNLSSPTSANAHPFEWQKANRLVYCNYLEHLILHLKIGVLRQKKPFQTPIDMEDFFTTGGYWEISRIITDMYHNVGLGVAWKRRCFEEIKDNYNDYLAILNLTLYYLNKEYIGERNPAILKKGRRIAVPHGGKMLVDINHSIIEQVYPNYDFVQLRYPDGKVVKAPMFWLKYQLSYSDTIQCLKIQMASGYPDTNSERQIYQDTLSALSENGTQQSELLYNHLKIDYRGYGFPQFSSCFIDHTQWGSDTVDEYISQAFPECSRSMYDIGAKKPVFWKGKIPLKVSRSEFYIIRFDAVFEIKDGETAFARNKTVSFARNNLTGSMDDENNFLYKWGTIVPNSYIWDKKTNRYWDVYKDFDGKIVPASLTLTLTKADFELFKKRYYVRKLKILDGCYFE